MRDCPHGKAPAGRPVPGPLFQRGGAGVYSGKREVWRCIHGGDFAAKEALAKALCLGIVADLRDISVLHDERGAPYYSLSGEYARFAEDKRIDSFFLSITHDGGVAAAVCVAERNG